MSVQFDSGRNRWVVRWSEAGRQRSRRFTQEGVARGFDAERREARMVRGRHTPRGWPANWRGSRARGDHRRPVTSRRASHGRLLLRDEAGRPLAGRRQSVGRDGHDPSRLSHARGGGSRTQPALAHAGAWRRRVICLFRSGLSSTRPEDLKIDDRCHGQHLGQGTHASLDRRRQVTRRRAHAHNGTRFGTRQPELPGDSADTGEVERRP